MTFKKYKYKDILNLWLKNKKDIKIQSFIRYEYLIDKYLIDKLGNVFLKDLSKDMIENIINEYKKCLSVSIIKTLLYIIKSSLKYAYSNNYCDYISIDNINIKNVNKSIYILSKKEQFVLENYLKTKINIRKVCLLLCLYTGLRIGEVCGLKWEDINFQTNSLQVKRTIERIKNKNQNTSSKTILIESTPKSDTSLRVIPIPNCFVELLYQFKNNDEFFMLSNSSKLYDPRQFEEFYKRCINNCHINYINFHTIRHTFATRAIESKMDIKTLSEILGHSSIEITLKLYVHPSFELKKTAIENLVEYMMN